MNIFEQASRKKLRFETFAGNLTTEQIWDLNLPALDGVARSINSDLKEVTEESFIPTKPHPKSAILALQLEILKHIIAVKLEEQEAAKVRSENSARRKKIIEALEAKDDEALTKKTKAQLIKELEDLGD